MNADLIAAMAATVAPFVLAVEVWVLLAGLFPATVAMPAPTGPDPAVDALRRRAAAALVAEHFQAMPAIARAPYVACGRAGLVERQQDTVALVPRRSR